MKPRILFLSLGILAATSTGFAQINSFNKEFAAWHKKAIITCGLIKTPNPDSSIISKNLHELEIEFEELSDKYLNEPPEEYLKDVNWKLYFMSLHEFVAAIKERAENRQYAQASVFCPYICMTVGKMHKINGTTDITDVMFSWRTEIKNTSDMITTGNIAGANQNVITVNELYQKVINIKTKKNDASLDELFIPLSEAYNSWLNAAKEGNSETVTNSFNAFLKLFTKAYLATI